MKRRWLGLFGVVAAIELVGVALDSTVVQWLAKPLLAPLLLAYLWAARRRLDGVAVGLVFATAGDVALLLPGRTTFLIGMGCFLGTQVGFLTAFLGHRRPAGVAVLGYLALWAVANALLWSALGPLRLPVLGYSLALSLMAAAAAGVSGRAGAGGGLFLVSDLLIGVRAAGISLPGHDLLVMMTYISALLLIVTAWAGGGKEGGPPVGRTPSRTPPTADRWPARDGMGDRLLALLPLGRQGRDVRLRLVDPPGRLLDGE